MKRITRADRAAATAERWRQRWQGRWGDDVEKRKIHEALVALGPTPDPDDVDRVIGNKSWTTLECDECNAYVETAVWVGESPEHKSSTAMLCGPCLRLAASEVGETK